MQTAASRRSPIALQLFEVTSLLPLSAFLALHVLSYGRVLFGAAEVGARHRPTPGAVFLEATLIWLPLAYHALYAGVAYGQRRRAVEPSQSGRALLSVHRLAGVVAGLFLVDHFVRFRWPILTGEILPSDSVARLTAELSATWSGMPVLAAVYTIGTMATALHLTIGLERVVERSAGRPMARARRASRALGFALGAVGVLTIVELAAGF